MSILVVSVSHKTTSVDVLSQLAMDPATAGKLADALIASRPHRRGRRAVDLQPHRGLRLGLPLPRRA